jgi:hypothetical protein
MKTHSKNSKFLAALVVLSIVLLSCSSGFKSDMTTGLKMTYSGLSVEDSYLEIDGEKHNSNKIPLGKKVVIILDDVSGLQESDGVFSIAFNTTVIDLDGNYILDYSDTLVVEEAGVLRSLLTVAEPMEVGQKYTWTSKFADLNGEGQAEATIEIEVVE